MKVLVKAPNLCPSHFKFYYYYYYLFVYLFIIIIFTAWSQLALTKIQQGWTVLPLIQLQGADSDQEIRPGQIAQSVIHLRSTLRTWEYKRHFNPLLLIRQDLQYCSWVLYNKRDQGVKNEIAQFPDDQQCLCFLDWCPRVRLVNNEACC